MPGLVSKRRVRGPAILCSSRFCQSPWRRHARHARSRTRAPPARSRARNSPRTRGRPSGRPPRPRVSPNATSRPSPRAPNPERRRDRETLARADCGTAPNRRAAPTAAAARVRGPTPPTRPPRQSKTPPREVAFVTRALLGMQSRGRRRPRKPRPLPSSSRGNRGDILSGREKGESLSVSRCRIFSRLSRLIALGGESSSMPKKKTRYS